MTPRPVMTTAAEHGPHPPVTTIAEHDTPSDDACSTDDTTSSGTGGATSSGCSAAEPGAGESNGAGHAQARGAFVSKALEGFPCTYISAAAERTSAVYVMDKDFTQLTVLSAQDTSCVEAAFSIAAVADIYCLPQDDESAFPAEVVSSMGPEEKELLTMVVYHDGEGQALVCCMLHHSRDSRDDFMEATSTLCMCAQMASVDAPDAHGAATCFEQRKVSAGFFVRSIGLDTDGRRRGGAGEDCRSPMPLLPRAEVAPYLAAYGYAAFDGAAWCPPPARGPGAAGPAVDIQVVRHIEVTRQTWYIVQVSMLMPAHLPHLQWLAPRRLTHLRSGLHARVREALGEEYARLFQGARFARRGGLPGTTAQLHRWCRVLASCINSRLVPPSTVALVLRFFEAPAPEPSKIAASAPRTCLAAPANRDAIDTLSL